MVLYGSILPLYSIFLFMDTDSAVRTLTLIEVSFLVFLCYLQEDKAPETNKIDTVNVSKFFIIIFTI